ncbi:hypothetical protein ACHAQH_002364 [Verticillium albo-atrum]
MSNFQKIALVGAGLLGSGVLPELVKAGIRRIIPSHYGSVATSEDPEVQSMPIHGILTDIRRYLEAKARAGEIEYTILEPGCFLETLALVTLAGTGKATVGVLRNAETSKNHIIRFNEFTESQNKLLAIAQDALAPAEEWQVTQVNSAELYKQALENQTKDPNFVTGFALLKVCMMSGRWGVEYPKDKVDNEIIGLGLLPPAEMEKASRAAAIGKHVEKHVVKK